MDFCHLHVHSDYSLLDGAAKVDALVEAAKERGLGQIALTDHGNMCGAIAFYKAARKHGVKPILGCEMYMAPGARTERRRDAVTGVSSFHLTVLARNRTGYRNLVELASAAYTEGFYYNPRIDREILREHAEGLLVLSGCFKGETSYYLRTGRRDKAYESAEWYREVFGENYFVEVQRNGTEGQDENNADLVKLARELKLPLVATNDVHYISRDDARAQEIRMAISTGKTLDDENRLKHKSTDFYLRPAVEMHDLFKDLPEALENTLEVASRCDVELDFGTFHLPRFAPPDELEPDEYFTQLCREGLEDRYGAPPPPETVERLEHEMAVIRKMGFVSYFLITWDFIRYARENRIPVGPGRGSAAGSIVAYVLRITDVCPLRYDLLFERFLNSERVSMPDIDIDFCRDGRGQVIEYVTEKYGGKRNVSQIITFGTMAARAVIRDVGRVLGVPLSDIDTIAKKIPNGPGANLTSALDADPDLQALRTDARYSELFDASLRLEGLKRHASTHAAGVVVGPGELRQYVPLYKAGDDVVTQYTMEHLEDIGLLKMDFLGLKTLTVLDKAVKLIQRSDGRTIDLDALTFDDPVTWELLQRGDALGVFQLESGGMRDLLQKLKPDRFEDLIAILALYRPGPLQTGMVDQFVERKHGREEVSYLHADLEPLLKDTYGTFVYQEQIMLIAHRFAGFSMNEADGLRKAMGKKKLEVMLRYKEQFVAGCIEHGCEQAIAESIWDVMEQFAKYAFNKSHTTAYAVLSYQTAYLKANYPVEFLAALMTCDMGNTDKVIGYIDECRRLGIEVAPPCVNRSFADFSVEPVAASDGAGASLRIRFGLAAVKGVGHAVVDAIVDAREAIEGEQERHDFTALADLCEHIDLAHVNRAALEALIKAGALDGLGGHRAQLVAALESSLRMAAAAQEDKRAGQMSLFGGGAAAAAPPPPPELPDVPPWPETEMLQGEKETLGFYMSSHPLARHARVLEAFASHVTSQLSGAGDGTRVLVGGMITQLKARYPRTGRNQHRKMARFRLEDFDGNVGCVMFADGYERDGELMTDEAIGFLDATVSLQREEPDLRVDRFIPVDQVYDELAGTLLLSARPGEEERLVDLVASVMKRHAGRQRVVLDLTPVPGIRALYRIEKGGIDPSAELHDELLQTIGAAAIRWKTLSAPARVGVRS